jgi:hypothetical protein
LARKWSPIFKILNYFHKAHSRGRKFYAHKEKVFWESKIQREFNFPTSDDKYFVFGVSHLQKAFYLLMLGYVLAVVCFATEIMRHRYKWKGREWKSTSLCLRQT